MRGMFRLTTKPTRALALLLMPVVLVLVYFSITRSNGPPVPTPSAEAATRSAIEELDQHLQSVAASALGEREGAIVVLDPQTGRLELSSIRAGVPASIFSGVDDKTLYRSRRFAQQHN